MQLIHLVEYRFFCFKLPQIRTVPNLATTNQTGRLFANRPAYKNLLQ